MILRVLTNMKLKFRGINYWWFKNNLKGVKDICGIKCIKKYGKKIFVLLRNLCANKLYGLGRT